MQNNSLGSVHGRFKKTEAVDETVHFRESEDNRGVGEGKRAVPRCVLGASAQLPR